MQTESAFGDKAIQNALKAPGEDSYFDVVGHGTPSDVSGMSPAELAAKVEGNPGWDELEDADVDDAWWHGLTPPG